jgi:hypothetical protein
VNIPTELLMFFASDHVVILTSEPHVCAGCTRFHCMWISRFGCTKCCDCDLAREETREARAARAAG